MPPFHGNTIPIRLTRHSICVHSRYMVASHVIPDEVLCGAMRRENESSSTAHHESLTIWIITKVFVAFDV